MKILKDILTGIDNETYDNARVLCFFSHFVYFAMSIINFCINKTWVPMDFASGVAAMAVGFGIHLYMKKDTEPKA
jgi:hypothetical protein